MAEAAEYGNRISGEKENPSTPKLRRAGRRQTMDDR
jgi:hypothetical protein